MNTIRKLSFFIIVSSIIIFTSCDIKKSQINDDSKITNIEVKNEKIITEAVHNKIEINDELLNAYLGCYLPNIYISKLQETKSHVVSCKEISRLSEQEPHALILKKDGLLKIFNYHEGVTEKIISINNVELVTKNGDTFTRTIKDGNQIILDNILYTKISNEYVDIEKSIGRYIAKITLEPGEYSNNESKLLVTNDGNIFYNNIEYNYGLELIFMSRLYDFIIDKDHNSINIENLPNEIRLLKLDQIDPNDEFPYDNKNAKFNVIDCFVRK